MRLTRTTTVAAAAALGAAVVLAACGSSSSSSPGTPSSGSASSGTFKAGGVLHVAAEEDDPNYDPNTAYDTNSYALIHTYTRQLYTNASANAQSARLPIVPDLASAMPTISSDGKTYTIDIKQGTKWYTPTGGRQVTAQDAIRGLKMQCNPVLPFGSGGYYTDTIAGMKAFCTGFAKISQSSAAAEKAYEENTPVSGLKAVSDSQLQITLLTPVSDFLHILTIPASSPRPIEAMSYLPDSPQYRANVPSDGPYRLTSYVANKSAVLTKNPDWVASTDTTRKGYVNEIDATFGGTQEAIQQQIAAGTLDMEIGDETPPPSTLPALEAAKDSRLRIFPSGGYTPYLVFNEVGGNAATKNQLVREAVNYAVDKASVVQDLGGEAIAQPATQIFSSTVVGQGFMKEDLYATPNSAGDDTKAKQLLTQAGFPNGISMIFAYRSSGNNPTIAVDLKASLAKAGINLQLKEIPFTNFYTKFLQVNSIAKQGQWDISEPSWYPDWEGSSERSYFTPLLDGRTYGEGSTNYGDYNDDAVNTLADKALTSTDAGTATTDWLQIDKMIMQNPPWVPLVQANEATFSSSRVQNFLLYYPSLNGDLTDVALS